MYRYTLQSGIRLSTHQLIDAVVEAADFPHCYLDLDTGVLITVNSSEMLAIWKRSVGALAMKRYLKLAPFTPKEQDELSREFITTVIALIAPKKVDLAQQAAQEGGWEAVEALLETLAQKVVKTVETLFAEKIPENARVPSCAGNGARSRKDFYRGCHCK